MAPFTGNVISGLQRQGSWQTALRNRAKGRVTPQNTAMQDKPASNLQLTGGVQNATISPIQKTNPTPDLPTSNTFINPPATHNVANIQNTGAQNTGAQNTGTQNIASQPKIPGIATGVFGKGLTGSTAIGAGQTSSGVNQAAQSLQNIATQNQPEQRRAAQAQQELSQFATQQTPQVQQAEQQYQQAANNPYIIGALTNAGMAESVSAGAGQRYAQNYAQQLAAKQQEVQNALTGQGQQIGAAGTMGSQALTGQGQQITSAYNAGQLGIGQQGVQTTALGNVLGATKPVLGQFGQALYYPGQEQGATTAQITPDNPIYPALQEYANLYATGQQDAIPASVKGNIALNSQILQMAQQQNPNFNVNQALGQAASQQAAAAAPGSASSGLVKQKSILESQANGAEANFTLMQNIASQGGVNNTNVPILNTLEQNVRAGLASSQSVTSFKSMLDSVRSQYANILGGGTSTDQSRAEAAQLVPGDISLKALDTLGKNLKSDAQNRIAGINQEISSLENQQTGGQQTGTQQIGTQQTGGETVQTSAGPINTGWLH